MRRPLVPSHSQAGPTSQAEEGEARIALMVARRWLPPDPPELTQEELDVLGIERVLKLILSRRRMIGWSWRDPRIQ